MVHRVEQIHSHMLTVNTDEHIADFTQSRNRNGTPVYFRRRLPLHADIATEHETFLMRDVIFFECGENALGNIGKDCRDRGFFLAVAHELLIGSRTECQLYRVENDGFARARFACEHGKRRGKSYVFRFYYRYIVYPQLGKHFAAPFFHFIFPRCFSVWQQTDLPPDC